MDNVTFICFSQYEGYKLIFCFLSFVISISVEDTATEDENGRPTMSVPQVHLHVNPDSKCKERPWH